MDQRTTQPGFSVINGRTIHRIIHGDIPGCVAQVEEAYRIHGRKQTVNPNSYFLLFPEKPSARIIALPAFLGGGKDEVSGIKWISSYPENVAKGIPRASAVLILNNYETGYPYACLESSIISAARTAGSALLAAEWLNGRQRKTGTVGLVGTGLIARYMFQFMQALGWKSDRILLHDLKPGEAQRFAREVVGEGHRVQLADSAEQVLAGADLSIFCTVAAAPYLSDPKLLSHNPIVLNVSLRDLAPELLLASQNVVDDVEHVLRANTSAHLTEQRTGNRDFIQGTLADVLEGRLVVDRSRPVIFSPFGLGVLDLAVGRWVYAEAVRSGEAVRIDDFFYEMTR
ncbi:MAG: 2,3-diaminopropionate biosynthesis protein SbnB [Myxococcota bacterium]|nr:2,3-diaminopropionate biosynthesis protein SbnB [Myxococcota bacterium]